MAEYIPPDPSVAEHVRRKNEEHRAARDRIASLAPNQIRVVLYDTNEPAIVRLSAMGSLMHSLDREASNVSEKLAELFEPLIDDPVPDISVVAMGYCPLNNEAIISQVRGIADSGSVRPQAAAILALAGIKDTETFPKVLDLFHGGDESQRNLAIEALKTFNTDEARQILRDSYTSGGRNENDKVVLAVALLRLEDTRGLDFLKMLAQRADNSWSVMAATWIYNHSEVEGLHLMRHILDHGQQEAMQAMVSQIAGLFGLTNAFTVDAIHEARVKIDQQLEEAKSS